MTRKDFQLIAEVIAKLEDYDTLSATDVCDQFLAVLASTNPRFDRERFIAAALPQWSSERVPA